MSVTGKNRSPLPFPELGRHKTLSFQRPSEIKDKEENLEVLTSDSSDSLERLPIHSPQRSIPSLAVPVEAICEDALAANDEPIQLTNPSERAWSVSRLHLTVALSFAAIIVASLLAGSGQQAPVAENQKLANQPTIAPQPTIALANHDNTETDGPSVFDKLDDLAEDLSFISEATIAPATGPFTDKLVFGLKPSVDRDNSLEECNPFEEPETPEKDPELVATSNVFYGPAPAPTPVAAITPDPVPPSKPAAQTLPKYGTAISWMPSLKHAMHSASKTDKLVFLLQVSGNFSKDDFT